MQARAATGGCPYEGHLGCIVWWLLWMIVNKKAGIAYATPALKKFRRRPTLPHSCPCSTIGAERLNFRVRDGNGCLPFAIATENLMIRFQSGSGLQAPSTNDLCRLFCGQASRLISTGKLNTLLCVHTRPINLVVFKESSGNIMLRDILSWGGLPA